MSDKNINSKDINRDSSKNEDTVSLLDIMFIIAKYKLFITLSTTIAAVLIVLFSIYTLKMPSDSRWNPFPNYYEPVVKIQIIDQDANSVASSISGRGSTLSNLFGTAPPKSPMLVLADEVLKSNLLIDYIIERHNIKEMFEGTKYPKSNAREFVSGSLKFEQGDLLEGTDIFYIKFRSLDPDFATEILKNTVLRLEEIFKQLTLERIIRKKTFIEERIDNLSIDLIAAKKNLLDFQQQYGITDLSAQAKQQANLIGSLQADVMKNKLDVHTLLGYLSEKDPQVLRLQNEIDKKNEAIQSLKTDSEAYMGDFIAQDKVPKFSLKLREMESEIAILTSIQSLLRSEYEMVKIEEADNAKVFQEIEPPEVPEIKAGPSRGRLCMVVTILVFILSIIISFIREYIRRLKKDPYEADKMDKIKNLLRLRKKK